MKEQQQQPTSPVVPPKSTLRPTSHILQRNKVDPSSDEDQPPLPPPPSSNKSNKSATLSAKRLSLRIPNAFRGDSTVSSKKFGFTLGSNSRRQRKQLDLTLFQDGDNDQKKKQQQINNRSNQSIPLPPPAPLLSDGSTLSSSSSLSSRHSNNSGFQNEYSNKNTLLKKGHSNTMRNPSFFSASGTARRSSQASFKSSIKTSSNHSGFTLNHRPTTPSLLSNSSTMNSPISPASSSASQNVPKASWLSNLFFFKQPKVCSLVVYSTHTAGILRSLHRLMNKVKKENHILND
jgi:hypothetical protein